MSNVWGTVFVEHAQHPKGQVFAFINQIMDNKCQHAYVDFLQKVNMLTYTNIELFYLFVTVISLN